jgi:hypothetical protein
VAPTSRTKATNTTSTLPVLPPPPSQRSPVPKSPGVALSPQAQDLRIRTELHDSFPVRTIPSDRLAPGPPARPRAAASSKLAKPGWTKTLPAAHNVNKVSFGASPACGSSPRSARPLSLGLLVLVSLRPGRRFTRQAVRTTPLSTLHPPPGRFLSRAHHSFSPCLLSTALPWFSSYSFCFAILIFSHFSLIFCCSHGHGHGYIMNNPHDYLITAPAPSRPVDPDNANSWVMLNQSGFVKLGNERVLQKLDSRISCEVSVPSELRARCTAFHRKSDKGSLFLTNKRVGRTTPSVRGSCISN